MIDNNSILNKNDKTGRWNLVMSNYQQIQNMVVELTAHFRQQDLSLKTGVPQSSFSKIKNGKFKDISYSKAKAIESFYVSWKDEKTPVAANN